MVCLEGYRDDDNVKILPCLHVFHPCCLIEWFKKKCECPLCKKEFIEKKAERIILPNGAMFNYSDLTQFDANKNTTNATTSNPTESNISMLSLVSTSVHEKSAATIKKRLHHASIMPLNQLNTSNLNVSINQSNISNPSDSIIK